jgi:hypothetical protein
MSQAAVYSYDSRCHGGITTCPQGQGQAVVFRSSRHSARNQDEPDPDISAEVSLQSALTHVRTRVGLSEDAKDSGLDSKFGFVMLCSLL